MLIKLPDIIKLGYSWIFRLRSGNDYRNYQLIKSKILINYLKKYSNNNSRILEVGVQSGEMTPFFKEISKYVVSIDIDKSYLILAKKKNPDSEVICCDVLKPPFKQNVFDMVILNSVIEHIPDYEGTFIEIYRLLRINGYIYIGFPPWYGIFGGHASIPFFSLLPLSLREKLSKYKFIRAYPTYPRTVKTIEKKIKSYFNIIDINSFFLPHIFIRYPLYEMDFFITFICRKTSSSGMMNNNKCEDQNNHYTNVKELRKYWEKIDFRF